MSAVELRSKAESMLLIKLLVHILLSIVGHRNVANLENVLI